MLRMTAQLVSSVIAAATMIAQMMVALGAPLITELDDAGSLVGIERQLTAVEGVAVYGLEQWAHYLYR